MKAEEIPFVKGVLLHAWNGIPSYNPQPESPLLQGLIAIALLRRNANLLDQLLSTAELMKTIFDVIRFEGLDQGCVTLWLLSLHSQEGLDPPAQHHCQLSNSLL
jgi:hypothetical protein